jgi:biopolymer transport protein TolQ
MLTQSDTGLLSMLQETGTISRVVLLILLVFSVWSWGIILSKALLFRKVRAESDTFWRIFKKGRNLSEIGTACEVLRFTPLVPVFNSGAPLVSKTSPNTSALQRVMQRSSSAQLTLLENRLSFLATTASAAPFVGLFGTVVGVLISFRGLGTEGVATLKAVGPGIADALLATAFGLAAAIPAVIAYNAFVTRLRGIGGQLDDLQSEMIGIAEGEGKD